MARRTGDFTLSCRTVRSRLRISSARPGYTTIIKSSTKSGGGSSVPALRSRPAPSIVTAISGNTESPRREIMSTIKIVIITALKALWLILYYGFDEAERRTEEELLRLRIEKRNLQTRLSACRERNKQ